MIVQMEMKDGRHLAVEYFEAPSETHVIQITHGASEHSGRYAEFARWLNERGISVYILNLRGHGLSQDQDVDQVIFKEGDEYQLVCDVLELGDYIKAHHQGPVILLGHSMGGMINRLVMTHQHPYRGFIYSGTRMVTGFQIKQMKLALALAKRKHSWEEPSELLDEQVFRRVQKDMLKKGYLSSEQDDWLTSDPKEQKKNRADHYLNQRWSLSAYRGLFYLMEESSRKEAYQVASGTSILFLAGRHDGSIDYGKITTRLYEGYLEHSEAKISLVYYEGMRHDLLHEGEKEKVYLDIEHFVKRL